MTAVEHNKAKRLQDICGYVFIAMFITQFVFQALILSGVLDRHDSWYAYVIGAISVVGFSMLYKLSSVTVSDVFALSIACFELFFMIGRPFLLSLPLEDQQFNLVIFYICSAFSVAALFMWTVFLQNTSFDRNIIPLIMVLPLPFVVNVLSYAGFIMRFHGIDSLATDILNNYSVMPLLRMCLDLFLPVGYWKLCHSEYFAGHDKFKNAKMKMTPFNWYFLFYLLIASFFLFPTKF